MRAPRWRRQTNLVTFVPSVGILGALPGAPLRGPPMGVLAPSLDPRQPTGLLLGEGFEQVNEDLVVESPYTGEPVARVAVGTADHVALAVEAARAHLPPPPAAARAAILERAAGIVRGRAELFAQTIATEAWASSG